MPTRNISPVTIPTLLLLPALIAGCANQKPKAPAPNPNAIAQNGLDAAARQLQLTLDQQDKLAPIFQWQNQQMTQSGRVEPNKFMWFIDDNGQLVQRNSTMADVYQYDDGKGMPTDEKTVRSMVDARVRNILSAPQYAAYKNDLSQQERDDLASGLRKGLRTTTP